MVDMAAMHDDNLAKMADVSSGAITAIGTHMLPHLPRRYIFLRFSENAESVKVWFEGHVLRHANIILERTSHQCKLGPLIWRKDMQFGEVYAANLT